MLNGLDGVITFVAVNIHHGTMVNPNIKFITYKGGLHKPKEMNLLTI
jgi:hypothetical protein